MNHFAWISALLAITVHGAVADRFFAPVRTYLEESVAEGTVAGGAVLVLQGGEVIFETGFGFADLKTKKPFRVDTPGVIASISKPLLGTAVFHLVEAGKLDVAVPISTYLPEFTDLKLESGASVARAPTLVELFTHRSGMRNSEAPGGRPWFASWTEGQPLSFVVARYARTFPFKAAPGTRYAYSGIGTDVAARVAEVGAGKPRNELMVKEVFRPLGMPHTYYRDAVRVKQGVPMPTQYYRGKGGALLASAKRPLPPPNTYSSSGGSIISTAGDLSRWLLMIRNRGVHGGKPYLAPETIGKMLNGDHGGRHAAGGFVIRKNGEDGRPAVIGHTGSSGTNCWIDFESDSIGIMLTQTRGKDIRPFRIELEKRITGCVAERSRVPVEAAPLPAR
jgi:CubicO group peptidase (beta-lactamase class C family)